MDKKHTVFIIGAGASKEANLPTGDELKNKISRLLDIRFNHYNTTQNNTTQKSGDYLVTDAIRLAVQMPERSSENIGDYFQAARHIKEALPQAISIDHFIDAQSPNKKIELCGKLAIVRSILDAEKNSLLYFEKRRIDSTLDFNSLQNTWYISFFKLLTENCGKDDLEERFKSITLIIFNYDRCIEHFIFNALQNYYRISEKEAADVVSLINISHPYGDVGDLPWMNRTLRMEFGEEPTSQRLLELSHNIKTFTEGTNPESSEILKIRRQMDTANKLVFLGFAFHMLNMQLISPEVLNNHTRHCFATTKGISKSDEGVINAQLDGLYNGRIRVNLGNFTCYEFFNEYWRSLAF